MKKILIIGLMIWMLLPGLARGQDRPTIFVGVPPVGYVAQCIGGDLISVDVMVAPGQSPHTYEPTPRQMMTLSRAGIYLAIGLPFERKILSKISGALYRLESVDISAGIERRMIEPEDADQEEHAEESDPHIWLSPANLAIMAQNIKEALSAKYPDKASYFQQNYDKFILRLNALDREIGQVLAPLKGKSIFVFHPAFGYFADHYGLIQEAVETGGKSPAPRQIQDLITRARAQQVRVIFVQPQFDPATAVAIADAIGGVVVPIDPLAENVLESLEDIAQKIKAAIK